jgi:regulator-associated protein of mTOR
MKDPTLDMNSKPTMEQQASTGHAEPRKNPSKSVRVAFGPDLETHIPPRDKSPTPTPGHHRSFTTVERRHPLIPTPDRPTSSSAGESPAVIEDTRLTNDRASDSARPSTLKRARSDYGPRLGFDIAAAGEEEEDFAMRHGWQEEYTSSEYLKVLHSVSKTAIAIWFFPSKECPLMV